VPHKKERIARIVALLEKDYPQNVFRYDLDTKRFMSTRIMPDVQVFSPNDQIKPVCVVEVGYTRPEKLHHYKQTGIVDIRWYGRDDGRLYSYGDVAPITHTVKVKYAFKPNPKDIWRSIELAGPFQCVGALDALDSLAKSVEGIPSRFGKLRRIVKGFRSEIHDHWVNWSSSRAAVDLILGEGKLNCAVDELIDVDLCTDVFCTLWTNGRSAIITRYCDVCGDWRIDDGNGPEDAWFAVEYETAATYESFMNKFRSQVSRFISYGVARSSCEKTVEQLLQYLDESGLEVTPIILDAAKEWGERLPWNEKRAVA